MIVRYNSGRSQNGFLPSLIWLLLVAYVAFSAFSLNAQGQNTAKNALVGGTHGHLSPDSRVIDADLSSANSKLNMSEIYPKCSESMRQYFIRRYILTLVAPIYTAAIVLWLLKAGIVARLRGKFENFRSYPVKVLCTFAIFYLIVSVIRLPIVFYSSYLLEHQFMLSHQSLADWGFDQLLQFLVGTIALPIASACFMLVKKYQRGWHLPVWLLVSACLGAMVFLEPLAVDPLFNKFVPLPESNLKVEITKLCQNAGLQNPTILVADKSKETIKLNAYVTGFSASKRIVLFDNLTHDIPTDQVLAVVAHEIGHYKLKHVVKGIILAVLALYPLFFIAEKGIDKILPRLPKRWGIKSTSDPALIAIWFIVLLITPLFISPLDSFVSRLFESEADAYGIALTGNPMAAARLFNTLSKVNLSDPDPPAFIEFWFFSHPSIKHRIDNALAQLAKSKLNQPKQGGS